MEKTVEIEVIHQILRRYGFPEKATEQKSYTDLFVLEEYRTTGYERKLLTKALELNQPNSMMVLMDVDDASSICLYESVGFAKVQGENNLTAYWMVPEDQRQQS